MDKRIVITEEDVTSNGSVLSSRDIVYVPGFCYYAEGAPEATAKVGQPVLCTTIEDFQLAFGEQPAAFLAAQPWPEYVGEGEVLKAGFVPSAIPPKSDPQAEENIWFAADSVDPAYVYAYELIARGIPVVYERMNKKNCRAQDTDVTIKDFYANVRSAFFYVSDLTQERTLLTDPTLPIKYITLGGYPSFEYFTPLPDASTGRVEAESLAEKMATLALTRGDAFALIDHTNYPGRILYGSGSVFFKAQTEFEGYADAQTYATMFTPWANYSLLRGYDYNGNFPGSYAYLTCLAKVIATNPAWTAIAGVSRGLVPQLNELCLAENRKLTNAIANAYQPDETDKTNKICINPITNIKGYGYCIWGDRTVRNQGNTKGYALNFLHIRNLICDIKKLAYDTSTSLMFEPNSNTLWGNFKGALTPTLDRMKATQGISDYAIIKLPSDSKTKLVAKINIYPMYAVEKFEIFINITDEEVSVG